MTFADAIASGFKNYAKFKGQATRSEFWYWVLFTILLSLVLGTLESVMWPVTPVDSEDLATILQSTLSAPTPLTTIANIVLFVPGLAVTARRFRDAGFSAKWLLLLLVPAAYSIFAIIGLVAIGTSYSDTEMPSVEDIPLELMMSIIFLVAPIFALGFAVFVIHTIFALKPSRSFYDGNKYVEPTPLSSVDEGTTA
ncbi:MAG: hypothetical protein RL024_454 [Actinomycetota bacterium]|jgi:uncharacterized membrane protein YhaH (DUF805 family)